MNKRAIVVAMACCLGWGSQSFATVERYFNINNQTDYPLTFAITQKTCIENTTVPEVFMVLPHRQTPSYQVERAGKFGTGCFSATGKINFTVSAQLPTQGEVSLGWIQHKSPMVTLNGYSQGEGHIDTQYGIIEQEKYDIECTAESCYRLANVSFVFSPKPKH